MSRQLRSSGPADTPGLIREPRIRSFTRRLRPAVLSRSTSSSQGEDIEQDTPPTTPFMTLPPELRTMIYTFLLSTSETKKAIPRDELRTIHDVSVPLLEHDYHLYTTILRVNKQIHDEAMHVWKRFLFISIIPPDVELQTWVEHHGLPTRAGLRKISCALTVRFAVPSDDYAFVIAADDLDRFCHLVLKAGYENKNGIPCRSSISIFVPRIKVAAADGESDDESSLPPNIDDCKKLLEPFLRFRGVKDLSLDVGTSIEEAEWDAASTSSSSSERSNDAARELSGSADGEWVLLRRRGKKVGQLRYGKDIQGADEPNLFLFGLVEDMCRDCMRSNEWEEMGNEILGETSGYIQDDELEEIINQHTEAINDLDFLRHLRATQITDDDSQHRDTTYSRLHLRLALAHFKIGNQLLGLETSDRILQVDDENAMPGGAPWDGEDEHLQVLYYRLLGNVTYAEDRLEGELKSLLLYETDEEKTDKVGGLLMLLEDDGTLLSKYEKDFTDIVSGLIYGEDGDGDSATSAEGEGYDDEGGDSVSKISAERWSSGNMLFGSIRHTVC